MENLFGRASAIRQIEAFIDKPFIKVITGIRRCGKSSILLLLAKRLKKMGISNERLIFINFEDLDYAGLNDYKKLYAFIKGKMKTKMKYYVFLDEIQEVQNWEKTVNSLLQGKNADIYITGSNSKLLSSELSTYIAGRYVEFQIKPLSFAEFREFNGKNSVENDFKSYLRKGGFPSVNIYPYSETEIHRIVYDIYNSAILRDVVQRNNIRNVELLDRISKFIFDNLGNLFSAKKIADYFKSQNRSVDIETIYNYLNALEQAFVIKKIQRFDIKGKEILKTQEKYFVSDHSIVYSIMGYKDRFISGVLENVLMQEMERRGYRVFVGKLNNAEIDFVGEKQNKKIYLQVCYQLNSQSTIKREFSPLELIRDNHPKFVVSMDSFFKDSINGIEHKFIGDFLLEKW
ncbi:MAG: ATP-binding protein [Fibromonadaceae bacterium]|jgi:predicted AAA+ superfamily ATPase|nr:ATP-binding protein [Fibromonadaceae bacterium]